MVCKSDYWKNPELFRLRARLNYQKNRTALIKYSNLKTKEKRNRFYALKLGKSCTHCGESHPATLEYHHRNPAEKELTIGKVSHYSLKRLLAELEKCDILCSNCHRKLHWDSKVKTNSAVA